MRRYCPAQLAGVGLVLVSSVSGVHSEPCSFALGPTAVALELNSAHLTITIDDTTPSALHVETDSEGCEASWLLELDKTKDGLLVRRREAAAACGLRIDLSLLSTQSLAIRGQELEVALEVVRSEEAGTESEVSSGRAPGVASELSLDSSELSMTGVRDASVSLLDSFFVAESCGGSLALDVRGGTAQINGHRGPITVTAVGADLSITDSEGSDELKLHGGTFEGRRSTGVLTGAAEATQVFLDQWSGVIRVEGTASSVEVRSSHGESLTIAGPEIAAVVEGWEGAARITLDAGSLQASDILELVEVKAHDAEVDLEDLAGPAKLELIGGAVAAVRRAVGTLIAVVDASSLEVRGANIVAVQATDAEITLAEIGKAQRLEFTRCTVDLDLRGVRQRQRMTLEGRSFASVMLSGPCQVLTPGADALFGGNTRITGCEHLLSARRSLSPRRRTGKRPVLLVVQLDEASELAVTGD